MSRTRTTVGTSVSRAIGDSLLPDSARISITKALLEQGDISEYMVGTMAESIAVKADSMYAYAGSGKYAFGLPSGQFTIPASSGNAEVIATLTALSGAAVTLDYMHYGAPNNLHIGWIKLIAVYGYNSATNELVGLSTTLGGQVYLDDMVVVVPSVDSDKLSKQSLEQWGIAARAGYTPERTTGTAAIQSLLQPSPVQVDSGSTTEHLLVKYIWKIGDVVHRGSLVMSLTGYNSELFYFHAKYLVGGVAKYWIYQDGLGTYPTLDAIFGRAHLPNGSFFPFAYFRYNNHSEVDDKTTLAYKTSKKLVKYLGMDYDQVGTAVNANPNIANVEQAILMMAVPANTTNPIERRYLWDFFNNLHLANQASDRATSEAAAALWFGSSGLMTLNAPGIVIQDTRFKLSIDNDGVYKRRVAGSVGGIGGHDSGFSMVTTSQPAVSITGGDASTESPYTLYTTTKYHYFRRQISIGYYDEIQVVNLTTMFHIFEQYSSIGDATSTILLIPVDRAIAVTYSLPDKETLYARSLHYVFNSRVVTHVAWYETGLFKALVVIIAVVIAVLSYGSTADLVYAALKAGLYTTVSILVASVILEMVVVSLIFKLIVKAVGVKAAFVIAIVAACAGGIDAVDTGSVSGAPFAKDLLTLSSSLSSAVGADLKREIQGLASEYATFSALEVEKNKLLQTAQDLLKNQTRLSPFAIFGESPQDFYNRTVHSGNIGIVGIDAVASFVDRALILPSLNDSFGGNEL